MAGSEATTRVLPRRGQRAGGLARRRFFRGFRGASPLARCFRQVRNEPARKQEPRPRGTLKARLSLLSWRIGPLLGALEARSYAPGNDCR